MGDLTSEICNLSPHPSAEAAGHTPTLHAVTTRILSRWTVAATLILVAVGGFTRGSGSGFGCADQWPLCQDGLLGGLLPRAEFHMIVEWSHRWLAALVGVLAVATAIVAWRRARRWIAWVAISGVVTIGIQAWVGRLVVVKHLDADLVSLHLVISMTVAALITVVAVATTPTSGTMKNRTWTYLFGTGATVAFSVLLLGSFVHNLYIPGWPIMNAGAFPSLSNKYITLHYFHRVVAAGGLVLLGWLAVRARRDLRPRFEQWLLWVSLGMYSLAIGLGAAHVFTKVMWSGLVSAHLGVASVVWVAMVAATASAAGLGASSTSD